MNTKKYTRGKTEIAFLEWLLYMQIPRYKTGNPSLLALHKERKSRIQRFYVFANRRSFIGIDYRFDSSAFENSEVMRVISSFLLESCLFDRNQNLIALDKAFIYMQRSKLLLAIEVLDISLNWLFIEKSGNTTLSSVNALLIRIIININNY